VEGAYWAREADVFGAYHAECAQPQFIVCNVFDVLRKQISLCASMVRAVEPKASVDVKALYMVKPNKLPI
jgi:hypothetical protein